MLILPSGAVNCGETGSDLAMRCLKSNSMRLLVCAFALLGATLTGQGIDRAQAQAAAPFAGLSGKWSGEGSIALASGATERLRCDATDVISGGGATLDMSLRCASDSYNFDLRINLVDTAGQIVGNWNEISKNVSGGISGHDSKGLIQVNVQGQTFSAQVAVGTRGNEQSVKIASQSGDLQRVTIKLRRAG